MRPTELIKKVKNKVVRTIKGTPAPQPAPPAPAPKPIVMLKQEGMKPKTILDLKPEFCSGCGACVNTCPVGAITMGRDSEGFLLPSLDTEKCISCKKCAQVCPVIHTIKENNPDPPCYAVMAEDEIRRSSSSGGAFSLLANYMLEQGGYICGAAFDEEFTVRHIIINSKEDLPRLRGSKYVQSYTGQVFTQIRDLLKQDKKVLFTGCPCQVAGLKSFLGKPYPNLLTADLVCHGGPSQKVFDRYVEDTYGKENLKDFKFRTKEFGYNSFNQIAYLKDGTKVPGNIAFDPYEKCMHRGLAAKSICADCPFAPAPRQGDVTIGDFWGVSKHNPALNDGLGTSVFLVNNEHGQKVFEAIQPNCKLAEPVPFTVARQNNRFGSHMRIPGGRHWFFNMLDSKRFDLAVDYALNRKFDVGVVGLWYGVNYGSMATYFALHHVLTQMGLSVLMIENCLRPAAENTESKIHPRRIAREFYDISQQYPLHELKKLNQFCDTFVVGADQLWNVGLSRPYRQTYFLDFAEDNKKKISVGTSFGKEYMGSAEERLVSTRNLRRFDHVSVRDSLSKRICKDFGVEATEICDPTLFVKSDAYEPLVAKAKLEKTEPYILAYLLDPNADHGKFLHEMAQANHCKVYVILDLPPRYWENHRAELAADQYEDVEIKSDVDLTEWLWYYKNASAVITDSFHGTIFSILYEKPFITRCNKKRGAQRFVSLLTPLQLDSRLYEDFRAAENPVELLRNLDYTVPNQCLEQIRSHALTWLKDALAAPKKVKSDAIYDIYTENQN